MNVAEWVRRQRKFVMVHRLGKNLRSGDWNEELGILLLKAIAAVAPVPRQEDIGLDAVATLLRDEEKSRFAFAEDSFYVQLKSGPDVTIRYKGDELQWLRDLKLPFFVGVVGKKDASLRLFPGHHLSILLAPRTFREVHVHAAKGEHLLNELPNDKIEVWLGPPLLSFNVQRAAMKGFRRFAYEILKKYVETEQQNLAYRSIRFCRNIEWRTNRKPKTDAGHFVSISRTMGRDFQKIVESLIPGFHALALHASSTKNRDEMRALSSLVEELKKAGFEFDRLDEIDEDMTDMSDWRPQKGLFDS